MLVVAALSLAPFATPPQGTATVHYLEWTAQVTQTTSAAPAPFDTLVVGDGLLATIEVIFDVAWDPLANGGRGYHSSHGISTIDIGALSFTADPSTPNPAISIWETITPATDNITYVSRLVSSAGLVTATFEFSDSQGDAFVGPEINEIPFPFFPQTQSDQTCTATFRDSSGAVFLQAEVSELRSIHICSQACLATANSTRTCASTFVEGSRFVVDNDVTLRVVNLPTNAFGFFITRLDPRVHRQSGGERGEPVPRRSDWAIQCPRTDPRLGRHGNLLAARGLDRVSGPRRTSGGRTRGEMVLPGVAPRLQRRSCDEQLLRVERAVLSVAAIAVAGASRHRRPRRPPSAAAFPATFPRTECASSSFASATSAAPPPPRVSSRIWCARPASQNRSSSTPAAWSPIHTGDPPDERSQAAARSRGYDLSKLRARKFDVRDFESFDLILGMDRQNIDALTAMAPIEHQRKIKLLLEFDRKVDSGAAHGGEVPDPYYGGAQGFDDVLEQIECAAQGLLAHARSGLPRAT